MKSVLLIDVENKPSYFTDHYYHTSQTEPLGLLFIESFLSHYGVKVNVIKYPIKEFDWELINSFDIIGISGLTYSWNTMKDLASKIKSRNTNALLVAGREHVSLSPESALSTGVFDYVIIGEGEKPLLNLALGKSVEEIPSLVYRNHKNEIVVNKRENRILVDEVFKIRRRYEWMQNMFQETLPINNKMAGLMINRGCLYDCDFCTARKMWNGFNKLSINNAIDDIRSINKDYNVNYFAFHDLMINSSVEMLNDFCNKIIENKISANFFSMMSASKKEINFNLLRRSGFTEIGVGIEIPSDKRLAIGKISTFDTTRKFIQAISNAGIFVRAYLIIGWPWENNKDEIINNYSEALKLLPINNLRINFLTPFPGTRTYHEFSKYSIYYPIESGFDHYTGMEPVLQFKISPDDLIESRIRLLKNYYNSKEFNHLINKQKYIRPINIMNEEYYNFLNESILTSC